MNEISDDVVPDRKIVVPEPACHNIGYGVLHVRPDATLAEVSDTLRRYVSDLETYCAGRQRLGYPTGEFDTKVFELMCLRRALRLTAAVAECEGPVMATIVGARRGRTSGGE